MIRLLKSVAFAFAIRNVAAASLDNTTTTTSSSSCPTPTTSAGTTCPTAWTAVVADLAPLFRDSDGNCTDMARAAIRFGFHDASTYSNQTTPYYPASGGADGSLLLSSEEIGRTANLGLGDYHVNLTQKYNQYRANCSTSVGAADLIQVAAWLGVISCPGGQLARVYVGRNDTDQAAPDGFLPEAFGPGSDYDTILNLFMDKGFTALDLAALMGAHSVSKAFYQTQYGIPAGTPQDSTPGEWDIKYYNETYYPPAGIGRFDSDINLSNRSTAVGQGFAQFVGNQNEWESTFTYAFQIMSLLGIPPASVVGMQDCTNVVAAAPFVG